MSTKIMPGVLEGQNLELSFMNISEKNPENEETIICFIKVKSRDFEHVLGSLCLIWKSFPALGNFQHWWTSNLKKPFRSESQGLRFHVAAWSCCVPPKWAWVRVWVWIFSSASFVSCSWLERCLSHTIQDPKLGPVARLGFLLHTAHLVFIHLFQVLFTHFKYMYFKKLKP